MKKVPFIAALSTAALFLALVLPGTAQAFECSGKLNSCDNQKSICSDFTFASKMNKTRCRNAKKKHIGEAQGTCKEGIKETFLSCINSVPF